MLTQLGKVLWFDKRDGYGQIIDVNGTRYYFDISVIGSRFLDRIKTGCTVRFSNNQQIQKPLCAKDVELANAKEKLN